jgi:hypothetical protein
VCAFGGVFVGETTTCWLHPELGNSCCLDFIRFFLGDNPLQTTANFTACAVATTFNPWVLPWIGATEGFALIPIGTACYAAARWTPPEPYIE